PFPVVNEERGQIELGAGVVGFFGGILLDHLARAIPVSQAHLAFSQEELAEGVVRPIGEHLGSDILAALEFASGEKSLTDKIVCFLVARVVLDCKGVFAKSALEITALNVDFGQIVMRLGHLGFFLNGALNSMTAALGLVWFNSP